MLQSLDLHQLSEPNGVQIGIQKEQNQKILTNPKQEKKKVGQHNGSWNSKKLNHSVCSCNYTHITQANKALP